MTARRTGGFAYIAAIVFLVVLAGFALAALRLADTEQVTVNQHVAGARAGQAARAGLEWAFFRLKPAGANCALVTPTPDLKPATGFIVNVACTAHVYSEGLDANGSAVSKTVFELVATACNGAGTACDGNSADLANPDYVERRRSASICVGTDGTDCY
jgi:MSHA biogenesis protein MshP